MIGISPRHRILVWLPVVWLALVLGVFLLAHPKGQPFLGHLLPGLLQMTVRGEFPWEAWAKIVPRALLLTLGWLPWMAVGWIGLWALEPRGTRFLHLYSWKPLEALLLAPLLGAAVTATPLVLLGIGFWLSRWTVLATLVAAGFGLWFVGRMNWLRGETRDTVEEDDPDLTPQWAIRAAWALIVCITAWTFFHALAFPVDYWDALIYYIHYGEMTYEQGGFPVLVQLQVGLGLGANYPHLYAALQVAQACLWGGWSDAYGQVLMPLAGLGATLLIYTLVRRLFGRRDVAVFSALAFRVMPYALTYSVWCSDYAMVMYGTVALLATLYPYLTEKNGGNWVQLLLPVAVASIFPQLNYMGWIVWAPLGLAVLLGGVRTGNSDARRMLLFGAGVLLLGSLWATPWYIRNIWVTGNPVYAFFPTLFGGMRIDMEVLASCENEWAANGDGLGQVGATLWERIVRTPEYFLYFQWKWAPVVLGLAIPGLFLGWKEPSRRLYAVAGVYGLLVLFYGYAISGLYLYHTIALFPLASLFGARVLASVDDRRACTLLAVVMLVAGLAPGLAFSALGPKARGAGLGLLRLAGGPAESFYYAVDPADASMWRWIENNVERDAGLVTHENRYHVFRRDLRLVHLDDWDLLPFYERPWNEVRDELERRDLRYYLAIPNEENHPITLRLGIRDRLDDGYELLHETWETEPGGRRVRPRRLYRLVGDS